MTFLAILGVLFLLGMFLMLRSPIVRMLIATVAPILLARLLTPRNQTPHRHDAKEMDTREAREILGVSELASREDILEAHRRLMKHMHPDKGGSNYFAARINRARDVLLDTTGITLDQ